MKFAICNELFEGWAFDEVCRFARSVGYTGIEVAPFTLAASITDVSAARRSDLRRQAADNGIEIVGLHWLLARTTGLHLTSPDIAVRERTAAYLVHLAEACRDLGGRVMVFGSPQQRSLLPGVSRAEAFTFAVDTFRRALAGVTACGVTICFEPLTPAETDFITSAAEGVELVDAVGHAHLAIHLDVRAMATEVMPVPDLIRRYSHRAGHFHANDPNGRGPGFGTMDFAPIFQALAEAGYDRWVSVEVFDFAPDPETIARRSIDYMKACLPSKEFRT